MDRLHAIEVFVRVAEAGSFTKAAETLNMSRPSVSKAIQYLEKHLRTRLLYRTTRRVQLTQDGTAYYERCLRLLADFAETDSLFQGVERQPTGKLKVDIPTRIASLVIAPALPDFFRLYPRIDLNMGVTDRAVDLVSEGVDCVVRVGDCTDSGLAGNRLGALQQISCASPGYLAEHGTPYSTADLSRHLAVNFARHGLDAWTIGTIWTREYADRCRCAAW